MNLHIRQSTLADLPQLMQMADNSRKIMRATGNMHQWTNGYPSEEVFKNDIQHGNSYLIENSDRTAAATFACIPSPEPTYAKIYKGQWLNDSLPYYIIHRIATMPQQKGIFKAILEYCWTRTTNLRIDTHRDNAIMRHLLQKHGFKYCGIIHLENGDERLAYQKIIEK